MRLVADKNYCTEAKNMERTSNQPTFLDSLTSDLGGYRTGEFFRKCNQLIPWNELAEPLRDMYSNNTDKGGASNYPLVMMIKCIMLQKWFNLSDPMLEEMLCDRISFRRFIGLQMEDSVLVQREMDKSLSRLTPNLAFGKRFFKASEGSE